MLLSLFQRKCFLIEEETVKGANGICYFGVLVGPSPKADKRCRHNRGVGVDDCKGRVFRRLAREHWEQRTLESMDPRLRWTRFTGVESLTKQAGHYKAWLVCHYGGAMRNLFTDAFI